MATILEIDDYDLTQAVQMTTAFGSARYGYIVTPNVDHVIRYCHEPAFRASYAAAAYVLLDSRFLAHLLRLLKRQRLPVCRGSDLTLSLMQNVIEPQDAAVLVGGTPEQAAALRKRFALASLRHVDPPMNFIHNADAVETCLRDIEALSPFRFCFLAIGSPQQEIIAQMLKERGVARGLALCVGAAVNFLTGVEKRAPIRMQRWGLEWLFRLMRDPSRMAKRYLVRGPVIFLLLGKIEFRLRPAAVNTPA
jgi:N-acetylglucosaminyldiphosphoundecaprenol N-acetyl-beta-D-mannosaminyltransferase